MTAVCYGSLGYIPLPLPLSPTVTSLVFLWQPMEWHCYDISCMFTLVWEIIKKKELECYKKCCLVCSCANVLSRCFNYCMATKMWSWFHWLCSIGPFVEILIAWFPLRFCLHWAHYAIPDQSDWNKVQPTISRWSDIMLGFLAGWFPAYFLCGYFHWQKGAGGQPGSLSW